MPFKSLFTRVCLPKLVPSGMHIMDDKALLAVFTALYPNESAKSAKKSIAMFKGGEIGLHPVVLQRSFHFSR